MCFFDIILIVKFKIMGVKIIVNQYFFMNPENATSAIVVKGRLICWEVKNSVIFGTTTVVMTPITVNINNTPNQSKNHRKKTHVRVLIIDEKAYWKKDNVLYVADIYDNDIDRENAVRVDIMGMDKVELDKMIFIIDQLTDGDGNDSGSTGNK